MIRRAGHPWVGLFFVLVLASGCGESDTSPSLLLQESAPFLTEAESNALSDPDPQAFLQIASHLGSDRLIHLVDQFREIAFADSSATDSLRVELLPPYRRVVDALADHNLCPEYRAELDYLLGLDPAEALGVLDLAQQLRQSFSSSDLSPDERLEQMAGLQDELAAAGYDQGVSSGWNYRGTLATRAGQPALAREMFTSWSAHARDKNLRVSQCNAIASLIMQGFAEGNTDSTSVLLERGLRLANGSRLAAQTGRLLALTGYRDFSLGHYSSAVRAFEDSVDACRNYGSPATGLAHLSTLMRMYAVMESWTLVDQVSQRADVLLAEAEATPSTGFTTGLQAIRLDEIQARALMARGHVEESHAAYSELWDRIMDQPFEEASFLANFWIMGLLDHQRPDLASVALRRAEPYSEEAGIRHMIVRVPFWKARNYFQLGQLDSSRIYLDRFAEEGLQLLQWSRDLQIPYFALRCRLAAETDKDAAESILAEGLAALSERLADNDAGAGAFLDLSRARGLRWTAHDIFGGEPQIGYGLELLWRRNLGIVGHTQEQAALSGSSVVQEARRISASSLARLDERKAAHLLYQVREPWVIRWTANRGGVQRDTLTATSRELRRLVGALQLAMSTDPGDPDAPIPPELIASLGELGHLLLPDFAMSTEAEDQPELLLISGESFLSQIPFAPLNISSGSEYEPLTNRYDLSWVRNPAVEIPQHTGDGGLLIANPQVDPVLVRRYRSLGQLVGIGPEIEACRSICPGRELSGGAATKTAVTEAWSDAAVIYFLGHVIHNPEVPFLTTIPLTPPDGPHLPVEAALDIADVRSADLGGCRLTVLSGCGSGAPFADGVITAPSLGDAFLDAGAGASLQTFWRIRDESSVLRPEQVVRRWKKDGLSLTQALSAERREALQGPNGIRHPFGWGAWSLKLRGLAN